MICGPCRRGNHDACEEGDCQCPERETERIKSGLATYRDDAGLAEFVYSHLLGTGSSLTNMMTTGAGKKNVVDFIRLVLAAQRAVRS